ncbi:MAG: serine hydrolase [Ruthenibacterium sp.]
MKKWLALSLTFLLAAVLPLSAAAAGFAVPESVSLTASSIYVVNLDTGLPVVEQNSHERRDVASLTKLMTCLLLLEKTPDLDGTLVTAPTSIYVPPVTSYDSSTADIRPGETVTARTLLYAMLLPSGNEAAAITAYFLGNENMENFYAMMNARAAELGCTDTHFTNAHGLLGMEADHYSSAYDLALIAQACWQNDTFRAAASAQSYDMPFTNYHTTAEFAAKPDAAYTIYSSNKMMQPTASVYRSYITGMKTGSTHAAGRNFVSAATNDKGESYIGVVLGCPWDPAEDGYAYSFHDTANLYDWIFANFAVQPSLDITVPITEIKVKLSSETDVIQLLPLQDLKTILPTAGGADLLEKEFKVPDSINAPVHKGDVIGTVTLRLQGETIGVVDLAAAQEVKRNFVLYALHGIGLFFKSTYFRVVLILTGIYVVAYFALSMWVHAEQRRRRAEKRRRAQNLQSDLGARAPRSEPWLPPRGAPPSDTRAGGAPQGSAQPRARGTGGTQLYSRTQSHAPQSGTAPHTHAAPRGGTPGAHGPAGLVLRLRTAAKKMRRNAQPKKHAAPSKGRAGDPADPKK